MSSYADETYADAFFATEYGYSAWSSATDKDLALNTATRLLDTLNYDGDKTSSTQDNEFPRDDETDVPDVIKKVCCLVAYSLIDGIEPEEELQTLNSTAFKYASVSDSRDTGWIPDFRVHGIPNAQAWNMLLPYLKDGSLIKIVRQS